MDPAERAADSRGRSGGPPPRRCCVPPGTPVSYVGATFAQGLGFVASRSPLLAATAFLCAFAFTGSVPPWRALAAVVLFGSIAIALLTSLHLAIGLVAFWIGEVTPVFWVWQK